MKFKSVWARWAIILLLLLASYAAFKLGEMITAKETERAPASVEDFSGLTDEKFKDSGRRHIIRLARIIPYSTYSALQLGHFYGPERSSSVCLTYPNIVVEFHAENIAVSGDPVKLTVRAPCKEARDKSFLEPIPVPAFEFLQSKLRSGPFRSQTHPDIHYIFENLLADQWPTTWFLNSIRLVNETGSLYVSPQQIRETKRQPLVLNWSNF